MKKLFFLFIPLCLTLALAVFLLNYFIGYEIYRDVSYADGEENTMDIYIPKEAYSRESNGCVLFIHGGSWSGGDKSEEAFRCRLLAGRGYIAVTMNYTLWTEESSNEYNVFKVLDEIDAALIKVKDFTAGLGIKVDKAATSGYSAGAHLSLLYSYSRGDSAPLDIVFAAGMAGPADISDEVWGTDMAKRVGRRLTGIEFTDEMLKSEYGEKLLLSVSPTSYVDGDTPPTIIMHGGMDDVVPIGNSESLISRLAEHSVPYDYVYLKNSNHLLIQNPIKHLSYYGLMLKYCKNHF